MHNLSYYIAYLNLYKAEIIKVILYALFGYALLYDCLRDTRPELIAHIKEQTFDFKVVSFRDSRDYQVEGVDRDGHTRVHKITKFWAITDKDLRAGNRIVKQKGNTTLTIIQPDTIRRFPLSFSDGDEVW
ncbi:hypothetical protein [uncultured Prevotella sp.]|uniref:hypothetical protein n=1 Tax=uncultured Prevotella sp. TaxID=159272 RepID=UPI00259B3757|nr:hypothetical protein [uncultured Prevotella sp.]